MRFNFRLFLTALILNLLNVNFLVLYSQHAAFDSIMTPENRLRFGDFLFCGRDYIRAIPEYQSYLENYENDTVIFKTAFAYRSIKRLETANGYFRHLFESSTLGDASKLEYLRTLFLADSISLFLSESKLYMNNMREYVPRLNKLIYISSLLEREIPDSTGIFGNLDQAEAGAFKEFHIRKLDPPYRSPAAAGILSAVIPGAGKFYTGDYGDGITSLLLTGLFAFLAYDNFNAGHDFRAWLFTGVSLFFYGGGIYGSIASAQIYNAGVRFDFESDIDLFLSSKNYYMPEYDFLCR